MLKQLQHDIKGKVKDWEVKMEKVYYGSFQSPLLKEVFVASTERGLCMVDFMTSEKAFSRELEKCFPGEVTRNDRKNRKVISQLKQYLKGRLKRFDCPLDLRGTPFQRKAWAELAKIPFGETRSYKEIAEKIGHPKAFRAVGNANGSNPIPLILPCHRVIESNGGLGGFGHGLKVKKMLLDFEKGHGI